jgi:leucine-zipper of insertion element IS481
MNVHKNARLTPRGRERIIRQVESGQTPEAVAEAAGVCSDNVQNLSHFDDDRLLLD